MISLPVVDLHVRAISLDLLIRRTVIAAALVCLAAFAAVSEASAMDDAHAAKAKAASDKLVASFADADEPGVALSLRENGEEVYFAARGFAKLDVGEAISRDSVFCIGSVSKQFAAFGAQLLIAEGRLSLDDDVRALVPYIAHYDEAILVRDLIHHSSGLKDIWYSMPLIGVNEVDALEHAHIQKMIGRYRSLDFSPGTEWRYNNSAYAVLADVVAAAAGEPFPVFMEKRVFTPLGMTRTAFRADTSELRGDAARPYTKSEDGAWTQVPFGYASYGASGLWTSIDDLGKWLDNLGAPLPAHADAMSAMFETGKLRNGETIAYASGLKPQMIAGQPGFSHDGHDQEFRAVLIYAPDRRGGVVGVTNTGGDVEGLGFQIAYAYFAASEGEADEARADATSDAAPGVIPAGKIKKSVVGRYLSKDGVGLAVLAQKGGLTLESADGSSGFVVRDDDTLAYKEGGYVFGEIVRNETGDVTGFKTPYRDRGYRSPMLYAKQPASYRPMKRRDIKPDAYVGRYYSADLDTILTISASKDGLTIENFRSLKPHLLKPFGPETFHLGWGNPAYTEEYTVKFTKSAEGAVDAFEIANVSVAAIEFRRIRDDYIQSVR